MVVDLPAEQRELAAVDPGYQMRQLGQVIRDARRKKHLSLESLAGKAEVSSGLLSQIERGFGNPSYVTLTKISAALGLTMADFYQGPATDGRALVSNAERQRLALPHGITYELLSPDWDGPFIMMRASLAGRLDTRGNVITHEGTETTHVLSGRLDMCIGDRKYSLGEGDSITFDSSQPHWMGNPLNRACEILLTVSGLTLKPKRARN